MKKSKLFFISALMCMVAGPVMGAVAVKKAASVSAQSSSSDATASLVPTVLGLVSNVQQLSAKQKELTQECIPTSQEITFVDNMMKEWAKTGAMSEMDVQRALGRTKCSSSNGYESRIMSNATSGDDKLCYNYFEGEGSIGMVWYGYPRVGVASYCPDGYVTCGNKKKTVSDIYEIFNIIGFVEADYTASELTMAGKLMAKMEKCSNAKLSAKQREMWGNFLVDTMGGIGKKTNTADIIQQVSSTSGSNAMGAIGSVGSFVTQFMNK